MNKDFVEKNLVVEKDPKELFEIVFPGRPRKYQLPNPETQDFIFQLNDISVEWNTKKPKAISFHQYNDKNENENKQMENCVTVWMHGTTKDGWTVACKLDDWKPFFFLSVKDSDGLSFFQTLKQQIENAYFQFKFDGKMEFVLKHPAVGYQAGKRSKFIKFSFKNMFLFQNVKKFLKDKFPPPNREEIARKQYRNEYVVCEDNVKPAMRFVIDYNILFCGWVRLKKGEYDLLSSLDTHAMISLYCKNGSTLENVDDEEVSPMLIESMDIEQIRKDRKKEMPDPRDPNHPIASIASTICSSANPSEKYHIVMFWGPQRPIYFPSDSLITSATKNVYVFRYESEVEMLKNWVEWRRDRYYSPDLTIFWNGFDYDFYQLAFRILYTLRYQLPSDIDEWGRLPGRKISMMKKKEHMEELVREQEDITSVPSSQHHHNEQEDSLFSILTDFGLKKNVSKDIELKGKKKIQRKSKLEAKADLYKSNYVKEFHGQIWIDSYLRYARDTTIRVIQYKLDTIANLFLKIHKDDVHYSKIIDLFLGDEIGKLLAYNIADTELVMRLFFHSEDLYKYANICRINNICLNWVCNGQQLRVFGGYLAEAHRGGYVLYRPHYHPLLDNPDFFIENEADDLINNNNNNTTTDAKKKKRKTTEFEIEPNDDKEEEAFRSKILQKVSDDQFLIEDFVDRTSQAGDKKQLNDSVLKEEPKQFPGPLSKSNLTKNEMSKKPKMNTLLDGLLNLKGTSVIKMPTKKEKDASMAALTKDPMDHTGAAFKGGFVVEPFPGFYALLVIMDFNSLYPSIMISNFLDACNLVLDQRYLFEVETNEFHSPFKGFLKISFGKNQSYYFRRGGAGVLLKHTSNLLKNRKIAQEILKTFYARQDTLYQWLVSNTESKQQNGSIEERKKWTQKIFFQWIKSEDAVFIDTKELVKNSKIRWIEFMKEWERKNILKMINKNHPLYASIELQKDGDLRKLLQNPNINDLLSLELQRAVLKNAVYMEENIYTIYGKEYEKNNNHGVLFEEQIDKILTFWKSQQTNYNSKQNELKICANSTYGFCSAGGNFYFDNQGRVARRGMFSIIPISAIVTLIGRKTILRSKRYVEETYKGSSVVYGDTDSIFCRFPDMQGTTEEDIKKSFAFGHKLAEEITALFQFPGSVMKIVFEKTAVNAMLYWSKCYAYKKYEPGKAPKNEIKGLAFSKRDCSEFVSLTCTKALNMILDGHGIDNSIHYVKQQAQKLIDNQIPIEQLIIYKRLTKVDYSDSVAHAALARRINQRRPGLGPQLGDVVPMVYIDVGDLEKKLLASERIEEPEYIKENNLKVDYLWYLSEQFDKNVSLLYSYATKDPKSILHPFIIEQQRRQMKLGSVDQLFQLFDK